MSKKVVLKLDYHDDKAKQKAMKTVSGLDGVESIAMDTKDKKLTVTGDIDPVTVCAKLRKLCHTEILTVGPAKEPEKKKEEPKKVEPKKPDEKKKDEAVKPNPMAYPYYYQHPLPVQAYHQPPPYMQPYMSVEEDPNSCVIC